MQAEMQSVADLLAFLKPDMTKLDKAKAKSAIGLAIDALKPTTTWPGDLDDKLVWDNLALGLIAAVDRVSSTDPHVPTVGDAPVDMVAVNEFFSAVSLDKSSEVGKMLLKHPKAIKLLQENFSVSEQRQVVGNPFLITLLTILGPIVLDVIKAWLARLNKKAEPVEMEQGHDESLEDQQS